MASRDRPRPSRRRGGGVVSNFETRGPEFRYPSTRTFEPLADSAFPQLPDFSKRTAEALLDDPRQFADHDEEDSDGLRCEWWVDMADQIADRSVDAYNPDTSYLSEGLLVTAAECFSDDDLVGMLRAQLRGDSRTLKKYTCRLTAAAERCALKHRSDSFDHFGVRKLANGEARIVMDQRHVSRSRAKSSPITNMVTLSVRRTGARARATAGARAVRRRGSRRAVSRRNARRHLDSSATSSSGTRMATGSGACSAPSPASDGVTTGERSRIEAGTCSTGVPSSLWSGTCQACEALLRRRSFSSLTESGCAALALRAKPSARTSTFSIAAGLR